MRLEKLNILLIVLLTSLTTALSAEVHTQYPATVCGTANYIFGCTTLTESTEKANTLGDSTVHLKLIVAEPINTTYPATIKPGETYLFGCEKLTAAGETSNTLQQAGCECDSIVHLVLKVQAALKDTAVQYSATINEGETYLFGCAQLTKDTVCFDTLHLAGRDSVTVLTLKVTPALKDTAVQYSATINEGETYLFGCAQLTKDTVCFDTLHLAGRDSVTVLTLKVTPLAKDTAVQFETTIKQGETYLFGCKQFTNDTTYADTLHLENRDSVTVLILTVVPDCPATIVVGDTAATICESELPFLWHGLTLKGDTTMCDDTLRNVTPAGCDSIVRLTLTVKPSAKGTDAVTGCDSVVFKGVTYKTSTTVNDTIIGGAANGCDSIVTVTVTVKAHATGTDAITGCDSVIFKGITYKTTTTVYDTIAGGAANGCDSIVTVTITVKQHAVGTDAISGCDSVVFKGITYKADATVLDTLVAANGCDSIVTVTIAVLKSASSVETATDCNLYKWHGVEYYESGTYRDTLVGEAANGCDSICVLNLTIKIPYETTLTLIHKFGDRLLMIHRHEINAMPGWHLDSLDVEHPEYVDWHQINPNTNVDSIVGHGYTYSLPSGDPLPAGYTYYAYIEVPGANTGGECGSKGETMHYTIPAHAAMPALMPSLVQPGEEIRVINLNPTTPTTIRVFSADGVLHATYNVTDEETCSIKADYNAGFYMVEVLSDGYKSTLRYIVQ